MVSRLSSKKIQPVIKIGEKMSKKKKKKDPYAKYKGKISLMERGTWFIWVEYHEIALKMPFSWRLVH